MDRRPVYLRDREQPHESPLHLSDTQKSRIREITLGIDTVNPTVLEMASDDVLNTLENGHRLNRLLEDDEREIIGYIACEDFVPGEAYVKYLATSGGTGRNLLREIPAFLAYAKSEGYTKINFHGWNERLNRMLERFGFSRLRTDTMGELAADFYEIELAKVKTSAQVEQERREAFEKKYLGKIRKDYEQTLATFSDKIPKDKSGNPTGELPPRQQKERAISEAYQETSRKLSLAPDFVFGDLQQAVLKLKLARHFQSNDIVDVNVLCDALIESPKFLSNDKGSLHKLFETHEQKTIQKIAEMRKTRADMTGEEGLNPFEWVYETQDGEYALARLLNMPHLEEESEYMNHCVGTSSSYISKMKRGEVEIFSVRTAPKIDKGTGKLTEDKPVLTIEYNVKTGFIEQMKKYDDKYLHPDDPFYSDVIEILKELRKTNLDTGKPRMIRRIAKSETQHFPNPQPGYLLTDEGEVSWEDFDINEDRLVLKAGTTLVNETTPKDILAKMFFVFHGLRLGSEHIARSLEEVNEQTTVFVGLMKQEILQQLPETIQYYTSPDREPIRRFSLEVGGDTEQELQDLLTRNGYRFDNVPWMLEHEDFGRSLREPDSNEPDWRKWKLKNPEHLNLIRLTVAELGFPDGAAFQEIIDRATELGLDLCPPEVGPYYRLQYTDQPMDEWVGVGMKPLAGADGLPYIFRVVRNDGGSWLDYRWPGPGRHWDADSRLVFSIRKSET